MSNQFIRPELRWVAPDYHGAIDFGELAERGIAPEAVLDFSANSNPFGPVSAVWEAMRGVSLEQYPDKECLALRQTLGKQLELPPSRIVVGNGTAELLWLAAFATLCPGDGVLVLGPTFGEYARNARLMGAQVVDYRAQPEDDFAPTMIAIEALIWENRPRLVHLCNPNNPTGQVIGKGTIGAWADKWPQTLFVVDEAYLSFVPGMTSAVTLQRPNILVLRSMTKDYGLAGLRLGYAVGSEPLTAGLARVRIPWSVSAVAQAAGIAALAARAEYERMWAKLRQETAVFRQGLESLGYCPVPSRTHYFLMNVGDGAVWRGRMLARGMLVRLCHSYSLPEYVRIATRTAAQNERFLKAVAEWQPQ